MNYFLYESLGESSKFFFRGFPYIEYDILGNGDKKKIKNFFKRFDFRERIKKFGSIYIKWIVRDEDTPQVIAHKLYNSTHYYWIVLMINNMLDPHFDFPLKESEVYKYAEKKYGADNLQEVHHYESVDTGAIDDLPDGIIVDETYPHKNTISNLEYEIKKNDAKRSIYLLKPEYLDQVLGELDTILSSNFTKVK